MNDKLFLNRDFLLLDGGMGTMLQAAGLAAGELPELWNLTHAQAVTEIHRAYVAAGADIITTNTFGANRLKLHDEAEVAEIVAAAIRCAKNAGAKRVALDVGPTGSMLQPMGTLPFETAYDAFFEEIEAGINAGADIILIETMTDLLEAKAALLAAKAAAPKTPVIVTMSFEKDGRTFMGTPPAVAATVLSALGADAVGINCSVGPDDCVPFAREMCENTACPVAVQPNAGLPQMVDGKSVYTITPDAFADAARELLAAGVRILGGCCGTTPDMIAKLKGLLQTAKPVPPTYRPMTRIAGRTGTVCLDGATTAIVGERINPTGKKKLKEALRCHDYDYIIDEALKQEEDGADILDVNTGLPELDEPKVLCELVEILQSVTSLPLQIDSADPYAIEAAARICCGKPVVNSVNGKEESLTAVLPVVKQYGCAVIGLTIDEDGIPETAEGRLKIAEKIVHRAADYGIPREDILIDCLTMAVSSNPNAATETLRAVRLVKETLGCRTVLGVSNVSFGLPARERINAAFLTAAFCAGLDMPILNPSCAANREAIAAWRVLHAEDENAARYIAMFQTVPQTEMAVPQSRADDNADLSALIVAGRKGAAATCAAARCETEAAMDILNQTVIPALDEVGRRFEAGTMFLPQLMASAEAAKAAFAVLKEKGTDSEAAKADKGKILLATVKGDIHDIGKNIVKMLLENYGYTVVDLGRDVAPERIVETVIEQHIPLVGLSALMTTTVKSMAETILLLRENGCDCKIMVGGAVLTPEYADMVGADDYAANAAQSAQIAQKYLG